MERSAARGFTGGVRAVGGDDAGGESRVLESGGDDAVERRSGASPWKGAGGRWKVVVNVNVNVNWWEGGNKRRF